MKVDVLNMVANDCKDRQFLVDGFTHGFRLGIRREYKLTSKKMKLGPSPAPLLEKLDDEVKKGRIIGPFQVKPMADLFLSPLYVIKKPGSSKTRMIFNLSHPQGGSVNENIEEHFRSVQYCSIQDVGDCLVEKFSQGAWMAKIDLADAYRIVPIHRQDWKFLGIKVEDQYYIDRMLPMGASSSCQLFQRISDGLKSIYQKLYSEVHVFNYLDDFLFVAESEEECNRSLEGFEDMCKQIGIPLADHKTVRACQSITFLGLGIDARTHTMYIPIEKQRKVSEKLSSFLTKKVHTVKEWQSLCGSLNHLAQVVRAGRIYLGSLYGSLAGILSNDGHRKRRINTEVRRDLEVWESLLSCPPERPFRMLRSEDSTYPPLFTDASTSVGYGGLWGTQWFYGSWPSRKEINIATLELYPIYAAIHMMEDWITDTVINVFTDNQALVCVLNKLYSRDPALRKLLRPIAERCMKYNLYIIAQHIPGVLNSGPDMLSRGMIDKFKESFPGVNTHPNTIPWNLAPERSL